MAERNTECHLNPSSTKLNAYSILCISLKIITTILIILCIIVMTLWLIYQPQSIKAYVDNASLSTFNLSSNGNDNSLSYKLNLNLNLRNPNRKYSFYYERLNVLAFYDGYQFGYWSYARDFQGRKSWMSLNVSFEGLSIFTTGLERREFEREKREGFFYVRVEIYATLKLKMMLIKSEKFEPEMICSLRLPVPWNVTSLATGFTRTECDVTNFS